MYIHQTLSDIFAGLECFCTFVCPMEGQLAATVYIMHAYGWAGRRHHV